MEIFITIIAGVLVFILSQFFLKLVLEPLQELRKEIQLAYSDCSFYSNIAVNLGSVNDEYIKEASTVFRQRSTILRSKYHLVPFLNLFAKFNITPTKHNLSEASSRLMGLSNLCITMSQSKNNFQNNQWLNEIEELLGIKKEN
jgi:hypothetical protein